MKTFRPTAPRLAFARYIFLEQIHEVLPHLAAAANEVRFHEDSENTHDFAYSAATGNAAKALIEDKVQTLYGAGEEVANFFHRHDLEPRRILDPMLRRTDAWQARAKKLDLLAKKRPLNGVLPEGYGAVSEISPQLARILKARKDAWAQAGEPLGDEAWRTIDMANEIVALPTPNGGYKIFRGAILNEGERSDFTGKLILDERLGAFGGCYKRESETDGVWRLVSMRKLTSPFVIARAVIREQGRFFAREVIRRLRADAKPTFTATHGRYAGSPVITKVSLPAGKVPDELLHDWTARAERLRALAELRKAAVDRMQKAIEAEADALAATPEVRAFEARARQEAAEHRFENARDWFNQGIPALALKKTIGPLPISTPLTDADMPLPRASLNQGEAQRFRSLTSAFKSTFEELNAARAAMAEFLPPSDAITPPDTSATDPLPISHVERQAEFALDVAQ